MGRTGASPAPAGRLAQRSFLNNRHFFEMRPCPAQLSLSLDNKSKRTHSRYVMTLFSAFLNQFWPLFLGLALMLGLISWGRRVSLKDFGSSFSGHQFSELAALDHGKQTKLLFSAECQAFPGWKVTIPSVLNAAIIATGIALIDTIEKSAPFQTSYWERMAIGVVFIALGCWLVRLFHRHRIRKFLILAKSLPIA
jgi:hypothetical protein